MSIIVFKATNVFVEYELRKEDGNPRVLGTLDTSVAEEIQKLPFVDNCDDGYGCKPSEVVFHFNHPREVDPQTLIQMMKAVEAIINEVEGRAVAKAEVMDTDEHQLQLEHQQELLNRNEMGNPGVPFRPMEE